MLGINNKGPKGAAVLVLQSRVGSCQHGSSNVIDISHTVFPCPHPENIVAYTCALCELNTMHMCTCISSSVDCQCMP